jgi:vacuolar iron transporter family protein
MNSKGKELHFQGKKVNEHITEALLRGKKATEEVHGIDLPGHFFAFVDTIKQLSIWAMMIGLCQLFFSLPFFLLPSLLFAATIWKTARSALLGWSRIERVHRLIEEERWEIEHHRESEKEELTELYRSKGFEGKQLEEIVDVLMADENRLLQEMLQEELGLPMEQMEHPLKQASGAFVGGLLTLALLTASSFITALFFSTGFLLLLFGSFFAAKWEKNDTTQAVMWNLSSAFLTLAVLYFTFSLLQTFF